MWERMEVMWESVRLKGVRRAAWAKAVWEVMLGL
jgi:hypothetical protein